MRGTVKSKSDVERLFREGRRSSSYMLTALCLPASGRGRWAFIAGKKLGCAPLRSRCKRVLRECARELGGPWEGYDVAFIARRKAATAHHDRLLDSMRDQLRKLEVI